MIQYFLQASLAMAILYVPFALWLRKETFFKYNRGYLLGALAVSLLAPFIPDWIPAQSSPIMITALEPVLFSAGVEVNSAEAGSIAVERGPDVTAILMRVYFAVVVLLMTRIAIGVSGIIRLARSGQTEVIDGQTVIVSKSVRTPFSFFKWIFIPTDIYEDTAAFQPIFRHELAHVRHGHSFDTVIAELICALFWINPFAYLYKGALRSVHEYQADEIVEDKDLINYTQLLIAQSQSGLRLALTNQFFQSQLKSRIMMMMKQRSGDNRKWKYLAVLPLFACMTLAFAFKSPDAAVEQLMNTELVGDPDTMPMFPGCEDQECSTKQLFQFVFENLKYPEEAQKANVEGLVVLKFTVNTSGRIAEIEVAKGIGYGCDEEAKRVLNLINEEFDPWTPAMKDGKPVAAELNLPVKYRLPSDKKTAPNTKSADGVFQVVDEMPRFPGCEDMADVEAKNNCAQKKLLEYVYENIEYPKDAAKKGIEGRVVVQFIVQPTGTVSTVQVVRGIFPSIDTEVIRVIESFNQMDEKWIAGKQEGKAVPVQFTLPVSFKLPKEEKKSGE